MIMHIIYIQYICSSPLSFHSSEIQIKFDWCFPLYFLPLHMVNQTAHSKHIGSLNPSGRLTTVLSEFLSFSATHRTSVFSSSGYVQCTACQVFPNSVSQNELQRCYINLFLIAGSVQVFLSGSRNCNSCTGRINTKGNPLVNLSPCSARLAGWSHQGKTVLFQSCSVCSL